MWTTAQVNLNFVRRIEVSQFKLAKNLFFLLFFIKLILKAAFLEVFKQVLGEIKE